MARLEVEKQIMRLYGSYKAFAQASGVSVPILCQYVAGKDISKDDEYKILIGLPPDQ